MAKKNDMSLGEAMEAFLQDNGLKEKALVQRAISEWIEIVGKSVAEHTGKLWFAKGVFYIEVKHPAWKQELGMGKTKLKELVNRHLGAELVKEIRIV